MGDPTFPSFQIVERHGDDEFAGRNCGSTLSVGTVFTRLVEQRFAVGTHEISMTERIVSDSIHLSVAGIEAYRTPLLDLSSGMTALLKLSGQGLDRLKLPSDRECYLSLQAPSNTEPGDRPNEDSAVAPSS